jgi:predicted transcriptional regulator
LQLRYSNRAFSRIEDAHHVVLGFLEVDVMEVLWTGGQWSVREVVQNLERKLAYTTVMTTLNRLFQKGFLKRQKCDRAYLYSSSMSRNDWERTRAGNLIADLLGGPQPSRELLLSSLVDVVGEHDAKLLEELEAKIRDKRRQLAESTKP